MPEHKNMGISPQELARKDEYEQKCTSCGACCCFYAATPGKIAADGPASENPKLSYPITISRTVRWQNSENEVLTETEFVMHTKKLGDFPACIALEGQPGAKVECGIYSVRPAQCRLFMPGSNMCLTARQWAGFE